MDAVNDGWKTLCESVLTVNPSGKCEIMKAFAYHAKIKSVDVDVPNECCQSNLKKNTIFLVKSFLFNINLFLKSNAELTMYHTKLEKNFQNNPF